MAEKEMSFEDVRKIIIDEMGGKKKYNEFLKELKELEEVEDIAIPKDVYILEAYKNGKFLKKVGEFKLPHSDIKFY